jgi:hypothetical protein
MVNFYLVDVKNVFKRFCSVLVVTASTEGRGEILRRCATQNDREWGLRIIRERWLRAGVRFFVAARLRMTRRRGRLRMMGRWFRAGVRFFASLRMTNKKTK